MKLTKPSRQFVVRSLKGLAFEPSDINLTDYFVSTTKGDEEEVNFVSGGEQEEWTKAHSIVPKYPGSSRSILSSRSSSLALSLMTFLLLSSQQSRKEAHEFIRGRMSRTTFFLK
ncbi:MAG: hypothetical protein QW292_04450 [Candidatus Parvarchaeota archaeon]